MFFLKYSIIFCKSPFSVKSINTPKGDFNIAEVDFLFIDVFHCILNFACDKRSFAFDLFSFVHSLPVFFLKFSSNDGFIIVIANSSIDSDSNPFF